jgi:hypothetical protein
MEQCQTYPIRDLDINGLQASYYDDHFGQTVQINYADDHVLCLVGNRGVDGRVKNFEAVRFGDYLESGEPEVKERVKLNREDARLMKKSGDYSIILNNITLSKDEQELLRWLVPGLNT